MDFAHDPIPDCGCDLCDAALSDLNDWCDARHAAFLAEVDGGPLPFELAWVAPANDAHDVGEAA